MTMLLAHAASVHARLPAAELRTGGVEVIAALEYEWRSLCEDGRYQEPFYRPEWIAAYARSFAADKTIVLATARDRGRLIGVLPLTREVSMLGAVPVRTLRGAANVHTGRYDLVHGAGALVPAVTSIWNVLRSAPEWDVLELPNVPIAGAAAELVKQARALGYTTHAIRAHTSPYIELPRKSGGPDSMMPRTDPKFRSNLRRRLRMLEARGEVKLVCSRVVDESLARFYRLEHRGWKGAERSAIACSAATRTFYDAVAAGAERFGYLMLYALECGGQTVAMYYGLRQGGRFFLLKTAYDESYGSCSPGQLLTQQVLHRLAAEGAEEFDFLGISAPWKREWHPRLRPHATWYVFRGALGRLAHAARFGLASALRPTALVVRRLARAGERTRARAADR